MARFQATIVWLVVVCGLGTSSCHLVLQELEKTDVSINDGGNPDGGPPDSGPPDSGPPDSGPPDSGPPELPDEDDIWVQADFTCNSEKYAKCNDMKLLQFQCSEGHQIGSAPKYNYVWPAGTASFPVDTLIKTPNSLMGNPIEEGWPEGPVTCRVYLNNSPGETSPNSNDLQDFDRFFVLKRGEINVVSMDLTEQPAPGEVWIELNVDCSLAPCSQDKLLKFYGYDGETDKRPASPEYDLEWSKITFPYKTIIKVAPPGGTLPVGNVTVGVYYDMSDGDGTAAKGDPQYTDRTMTLMAGTMNRLEIDLHDTPPDDEAWVYIHLSCDLAECQGNDELLIYFYDYPISNPETYPQHYLYLPDQDGYPEYITYPFEGLFKFSWMNRVDFPDQSQPWPTSGDILGGAFVDYDKATECYISPDEPASEFVPINPPGPAPGPIPDPLPMVAGEISHVDFVLNLGNPSFNCIPDAGP